MKPTSVLACVMITTVLFASIATADDFFPPEWRGQPGSTHQRWEFQTSNNPTLPTIFENPYGDPLATITSSPTTTYWPSWPYWPPEDARQGVWKFEDFMYLDIPNSQTPNPEKEVWIQFTYYAAGGSPPIIRSDPLAASTQMIFPPTPVPGSTTWYHAALLLTIQPNPSFEQIIIEPLDCTVYIDEVVVDTRCFPEPTTAMLLTLPLVFLLRRR